VDPSSQITQRMASQPTSTSPHADNPPLTRGQLLYQQARQSAQPDMLVKRHFEQSTQGAKAMLADEFVNGAGRAGLKQLAATPEGQHALAVERLIRHPIKNISRTTKNQNHRSN
jgi:hypothetical protein